MEFRIRLYTWYEPTMCRTWLGVANDFAYKEFTIQSWMSLDDVLYCLNECIEKISMKIINTPEEWELLKEKFKELYYLNKDPDWTIERHKQIISEIEALQKFEY